MYQFLLRGIFPERGAAASGDATDSRFSDPKEIIMKLHVNRRHASAQQSDRVLVESDRGTMGLFSFANEAPQRRAESRAPDKALHLPTAALRRRHLSVRSIR